MISAREYCECALYFIAGMTDNFFLQVFQQMFRPDV
jgi:dGTP triphosphohydrolase